VKAPNGETVSSVAGSLAKSKHMVVFSDPAAHRTYVFIGQPPAGQYTVTTQSGSPAISAVRQADGLPAPAVSATVTGVGSDRTLKYTIGSLPGQTVQFAERSATVGADIGSPVTTSGSMPFTPAPGKAGKRVVVAIVQENGIPRETISVATYQAPVATGPASPRFVHARRKKTKVIVSWASVALATHYAIHLHLSDGRDSVVLVSAKTRSITIGKLTAQTHGLVTVAGVSAAGLRGPAKRAGISALKH